MTGDYSTICGALSPMHRPGELLTNSHCVLQAAHTGQHCCRCGLLWDGDWTKQPGTVALHD